MKRESAVELANAWYELVERSGDSPDLYGRLQSMLMSLLPDEVEHAAAAPIDGKLGVVAVKDDRLFVVHMEAATGPRAEVHVESLPLAPNEVSITAVDDPQNMADADPPVDFRRWELSWASGRRLALLGEVRRTRQWRGGGPDDAELFARALAGRLGWDVPDTGHR